MNDIILSERLPVLALRGLCVFPKMLVHFDVGREKSIRAVDEAMRTNQEIFLVAQKNVATDEPGMDDLYEIGTVAHIRQVLKLPGDTVRILVEGEYRAHVTQWIQEEPFFRGRVELLPDGKYNPDAVRSEALLRQCLQLFDQFLELTPKSVQEGLHQVFASEDLSYVADFAAQNASISYSDKQRVLEQLVPTKRAAVISAMLAKEIEVLRLENELQEKVQESVNRSQKEYYIREQMKVLRRELGDDEDSEILEYEERIEALKLPEEVDKKLHKEVQRLARQPGGSSEAAVIRNYLDICLELPWNERTKERVDVKAAKKLLDHDHFGLDKVKERVLEVLAVKKMAPELPGQIICLVGPPGTGKTSIAMSIAKSLNRKLARISLGGVHDEADIRGHRKTYIGAMPGRIINGILQAGTRNPLMLLDEIDKMGADYKGDPSAALLEVLDSEQNGTFRDHYIELPFDLSECMFITTANTLDTVPRPLLDRMEVIELSSYTDEEKLRIAKDHLLPKVMARHGLTKQQLRVTDEAIRETITCYTRESGVRNLERQMAAICRKADMRFVSDNAPKRITVTGANLEEFLGVRRYLPDEKPATDQVGLVTGLAWTSVGGETLEVEVNVVDGTGKLELTGNLGDVMKESAHAAMSYIRSRAAKFGIAPDFYQTKDIHVHFPEGAVPKDGPSAGITVCTAMVSALTGATVRRDIAMTGEISIRGRVLAIGGLKEKTMAALRHGVKTVIIPAANEKDLEEIDQTVRKALNFITVRHVDAVIEAALDFGPCQKNDVPTEPEPEPQPAKELPLPVPETGGDRTGLRQ